MKNYDEYDTDNIIEWYNEGAHFGSDRDQTLEKRKYRAALYISAHKELLNQTDYLNAYNKILDEYAREFAYVVQQKPIALVTDKERDSESSTLETEAAVRGRKKIEQYKDDAIYIVERVRSGKKLIAYKGETED